MSFLAVLPVVDAKEGRACLSTLGPRLRSRLTVVDNTLTGELTRPGLDVGEVIRSTFTVDGKKHHNLGFARSVNPVLRMVRDGPPDWLVVITSSMRFGAPGGDDLLDQLDTLPPAGGLVAPGYWHTSVFGAQTLQQVGELDENFYPAYYEDTDYARRMHLAGISLDTSLSIDAAYTRPGHGYDALRSSKPGRPVLNVAALEAYFLTKWGCHDMTSPDAYSTPYNTGRPLDYWVRRDVAALVRRYGVEAV